MPRRDGVRLHVRLSRRLIGWLLPARDAGLIPELDALHAELEARRGPGAADAWYVRQAIGFAVRLTGTRVWEWVRLLPAGVSVRQAVRSLIRRPGWTFGFVSTLALGVGGLSSVYAVANWVLLRPVPGVSEPSELVTLRLGTSEGPAHISWPVSHLDYVDLQERLTTLTGLAASSALDVQVAAGNGRSRRAVAEVVSSNWFGLLGVPIAVGRAFDGMSMTELAGAVVVSHALALEIAGDARLAIGVELRVNGRRTRVVGVAPPGFKGAELPGRAELWFALESLPLLDPSVPVNVSARGGHGVWSLMYGRLGPGATAKAVEAQANALMERIRAERPSNTFTATHYRLQAYPGIGANPAVRASVRDTLELLAGVSAFLLLLAIANMMNLAAMEAAARRGTTALRFALGARRRTLLSQGSLETLLLGIGGAAGGVIVAIALAALFRQTRLDDYGASLAELRLDARVGLFALMIGLAASLVAGLPLALSAGRTKALALLGRASPGLRGGQRVRGGMVMVQVALSVMLVVAAALLGRTVHNLRAVDLGFPVDDLVVFSIDPRVGGYEDATSVGLLERIEARLAADGGVEAAGFVSPAPLRGNWVTAAVYPDGGTWEDQRIIAAGYHASPGFLAALRGRAIAGTPQLPGPDDIVISASLALTAFPGAPPGTVVGRVLRMPRDPDRALRVVAVVEDMRLDGSPGEPPLTVIQRFDAASLEFGAATGWVRTPNAARGVAAIRDAVQAEAPDLPVFEAMGGRRAVDLISAERLVLARIAAVLGALGLLLAGIGLYTALGCIVAERKHDMGVRAALGATGTRLLAGVTGHGLVLALAGCAVGLPGAIVAGRILQSRLFGVVGTEASTYFAAALLILALATLASIVPASRAARVSPLDALRLD